LAVPTIDANRKEAGVAYLKTCIWTLLIGPPYSSSSISNVLRCPLASHGSLVVWAIEWTNPAARTGNTKTELPPKIFDWIESDKNDVGIASEIDEGIVTGMVDGSGRSKAVGGD